MEMNFSIFYVCAAGLRSPCWPYAGDGFSKTDMRPELKAEGEFENILKLVWNRNIWNGRDE